MVKKTCCEVMTMDSEIKLQSSKYEMLKCIWMASQNIEYKLCDNRFDCDNCMFDKVIRNLLKKKEMLRDVPVSVVNNVSERLSCITYDNNINYLKNNIITKEICPNTFYLGIDTIFTSFLDNDYSVKVSEQGRNIKTGQKIIDISGEWGTVIFSAPMNFIVYDTFGDTNDIVLKSQWLAIIGIENQDLFKGKLTPEEWDDKHVRAINIVEEIKAEYMLDSSKMMDGGTQVKYLYQLIGKKKYAIVLNVLNAQ